MTSASSWICPTTSSCSITARSSPTARRTPCGPIRESSTPISARTRPGRSDRGRAMDWSFFLEVLVGGLLSGVMYSLVAIGFVLIYKTSGVLNFAQGAMVLFAALTFVSLVEAGVPFVVALLASALVMVLLGFA